MKNYCAKSSACYLTHSSSFRFEASASLTVRILFIGSGKYRV